MPYVYKHIRLDTGTMFYIGIGKTKYRSGSKQGRNDIWYKIVSKAGFRVEIIFENIAWGEACKIEIELIKKYGRINNSTGILSNMTDGGDGNLGCKHSPEAIKKISESSKNRQGYWKGKHISEESKRKMSESKLGKPLYKARGKKLSERHKDAVRKHSTGNKYSLGRVWSEESRKKISVANKGKPAYNKGKPGLKGELNGMFGRRHTDESIRKNRDSQIKKSVVKMSVNGDLIKRYDSISEAARYNSIFATGISACCIKKAGFPTYKGFIWEYSK